MAKEICFLDWSKPYITLFNQHYDHRAREVENYSIIAVKYPNIDQGNPDDALNGMF